MSDPREDYLRILRFFRFRARFASARDDADDADTLSAIRDCRDGLGRVSGERFWLEMRKMLASPGGVAQLPTMARCGLGAPLSLPLPPDRVAAAARCAEFGADPRVVLGTLLPPGDREALSALCARWRLSLEDAAVVSMACLDAPLAAAALPDLIELAARPRGPGGERLALLLEASGRSADAAALRRPPPIFPLRGSDVVDAGLAEPKSPGVGDVLAEARLLWRDGGFCAAAEDLVAALLARRAAALSR
jgi:hypothetical protein